MTGLGGDQLIAAGGPHPLPEPLAAARRVDPAERVLVVRPGDRQQRRTDAAKAVAPAVLGDIGTEQDRRPRLPAGRRRCSGRALAGQGGGGLRAEIEAGHRQPLPVDPGQVRLAGLRPSAQIRQDLIEHGDARRQGLVSEALLRQGAEYPHLRLGAGVDHPSVLPRLYRKHRVAGLGPGPAPLHTVPAALAEPRQIEDQRHPLDLFRRQPTDLHRLSGHLPFVIPAAHRRPRGRPVGALQSTLEVFTGRRTGRLGAPGAGGQHGADEQRQGKTQEPGFRHSHGLRGGSQRRSIMSGGWQELGQDG